MFCPAPRVLVVRGFPGSGFQGSGFRVRGFVFGVCGLGSGFLRFSVSRFRVSASGFWVRGGGVGVFKVRGLEFYVRFEGLGV